jgi:integrase
MTEPPQGPRAARRHVASPRHPLTGKQFRVSARSERALAAYLHRIEILGEELRLGMRSTAEVDRALRRVTHGPITLERAARSYMARPHLAKNTRRRVASFLACAGASLCGRELDTLGGDVLEPWIDDLKTRLAGTTIGTHWRTLRAIGRYAAVRGWIGAAPWGAWRPMLRGARRPPRREAARTLAELARLLEAARQLDAEGAPGFGFVAIKIAVVVLLGLRRGELAGLRWHDVDAEAATISIARQYAGDEVKQRTIAVLRAPAELFLLLADHAEALRARGLYLPGGPVFPQERYSRPGTPRPYAQGEVLTRGALRSAVARARLPDPRRWTSHSLRDSFVSLEADNAHASDLPSLAERSRHASVASLVRYLRALSRAPAPPGFAFPRSLPAAQDFPATPRTKKPPINGGR